MEQNNTPRKKGKGGRPPKNDTASNCVMVHFNNEEYTRFLTLYEESDVYAKAVFIKARVFGQSFRVIKIDGDKKEYVANSPNFTLCSAPFGSITTKW